MSEVPQEDNNISASPIEEFSATLEALSLIKPPGVSGSKIRKLQELAVANVEVFIHFS